MKKILIAMSAASFLAASPLAALADEALGAIASVDATAGTITLDDGNTYTLPKDLDAASLQVGEKVKVEFDKDASGAMTATSVEPQA